MSNGITLDRRALLTGAATAGAALAAGMPHEAAAAAPMQGLLRPTYYRFLVGDFEVTTILDGAIQLDGPHPIFGENVPADDVATLCVENFLPAGKFEIVFTVTLVNTGERLILFDTGNGAARRPNAGRLVELLAGAGVTPEQVDVVAITHFHPDHIGGLMEGGSPAFPNASYVMGAAEYDFWADPAHLASEAMKGRVAPVHANVVPLAEKARMIRPGDAVAGGIEAVDSRGHTPGHLSYHVESGGERLLILGDVCNHYVVSMQRPAWHVSFDMDKEQAVATRREVLGMLAADRIPFVGYHMPPPAVGYVEAKGEGFRYVPVGYQLNL